MPKPAVWGNFIICAPAVRLSSTKLKPLPQKVRQRVRQSRNVPQDNIEREWERVDVFTENWLAVCEADGLHVQQGAGRVV